MNGFERLIPFAVFAAYVVGSVVKARRSRGPRMVPDVRAIVPPPVAEARPAPQRRTLPVARLPERADPRPPAPRAPAGATVPGRPPGPRWAANAIIAAEVFGPPLAARPGGTLGPPNAL